MCSSVGPWRSRKTTRGCDVYKDVDFKEKMLQDLAETSNKLFRNLTNKGGIAEKELKYFTKSAGNCGFGHIYGKNP